MKNIILNFLKWLVYAILIIILFINLFVIFQVKRNPTLVPNVFGYKFFVAMSGSMKPQFDVGDLVIVKNADVNNLKVNDIISFNNKDNFITTHRINEIINRENDVCFVTKGDSNNVVDDGFVCHKNIEGKYVIKIKKIGLALLFIQQPSGFIIMMLVLLIIGLFIYNLNVKK